MWAPEVQQQLTFPNTGDLAADFKTQIKSVIDLSNDPNFGPSFRALVAEGQHDQALASQLLARIFRPRIEAAKERLRAAQQDGQLAPDLDLDLAIDLFYGGFYHRFLLRVAPLNHEHAEAVVDAVLTGIGTSARSDAKDGLTVPRTYVLADCRFPCRAPAVCQRLVDCRVRPLPCLP
jgi:hypothetical protein